MCFHSQTGHLNLQNKQSPSYSCFVNKTYLTLNPIHFWGICLIFSLLSYIFEWQHEQFIWLFPKPSTQQMLWDRATSLSTWGIVDKGKIYWLFSKSLHTLAGRGKTHNHKETRELDSVLYKLQWESVILSRKIEMYRMGDALFFCRWQVKDS